MEEKLMCIAFSLRYIGFPEKCDTKHPPFRGKYTNRGVVVANKSHDRRDE